MMCTKISEVIFVGGLTNFYFRFFLRSLSGSLKQVKCFHLNSLRIFFFNPVALRTQWSLDQSECNRVNHIKCMLTKKNIKWDTKAYGNWLPQQPDSERFYLTMWDTACMISRLLADGFHKSRILWDLPHIVRYSMYDTEDSCLLNEYICYSCHMELVSEEVWLPLLIWIQIQASHHFFLPRNIFLFKKVEAKVYRCILEP